MNIHHEKESWVDEYDKLNLAFYAGKGDHLRIKSLIRSTITREREKEKARIKEAVRKSKLPGLNKAVVYSLID